MATTIDIALIYDTVLASPGMSENVKINLSVSRKTVLLLTQTIEKGLQAFQMNEQGSNFSEFAGKQSLAELDGIISDCLQKAGLTELNEKLKTLNAQ
ncbi:hypothetical protein [Dyadobacter frigoris]|uniref:Uncharacterized protein n=1 Tax=Dyadobacter frigoris TaxID=2576211 RepID=A0A4V6BHL3_9BACT|nr:hypothetical protein [Dyadobacter frigoris]TKT85473.1 hypothetical protein FDK13_33700 [Dyadobacter frigoris]GLU56250.1 hypothetical protein Dfri01_57110 [Dyadobacter frigoris]